MVTLNPLDLSSKPNEAETIPLPKEEVTPPVTKMYFVFFLLISLGLCKVNGFCKTRQQLTGQIFLGAGNLLSAISFSPRASSKKDAAAIRARRFRLEKKIRSNLQ